MAKVKPRKDIERADLRRMLQVGERLLSAGRLATH